MQTRRSISRRMHNVLVLQKSIATQDDNGQPIESWSDVTKLRCEIVPKTAREFARNENIDDAVDSIIRCRFVDADLTTLYRFTNLDGSVVYNITGAFDPEQRRKMLEVFVTQEAV